MSHLEKATFHIKLALEELGWKFEVDEMKDTPRRFATWLRDFSPKDKEVPNVRWFPNEENYTGVVYDRCEIYSICAHHGLPVVGIAHLAYIPDKRLLGLSKLSRIADWHARQPTTQETLTDRIANYINEVAQPRGVAVSIAAKHFCKCMRGVGKQNGNMRTTRLLGVFSENPAAQAEFIQYSTEGSLGHL